MRALAIIKAIHVSPVTVVLMAIWLVYSVPLVMKANGDNQAADNVFLWVACASYAVDIYRSIPRLKAAIKTGNTNG